MDIHTHTFIQEGLNKIMEDTASELILSILIFSVRNFLHKAFLSSHDSVWFPLSTRSSYSQKLTFPPQVKRPTNFLDVIVIRLSISEFKIE